MGTPSRTKPREAAYQSPLFAWGVLCALAALIFLSYLATSRSIGQGEVIMPLDDAYIHFQYARQLANGEPNIYNPGEAPTSGATSFIYPYVLAIGYTLGFKGLNLGLWAMAVGAITLLVSGWLIYRITDRSLLFAILFMLNGAVSWHFMSGMETGIVMMLTLATLHELMRSNGRVISRPYDSNPDSVPHHSSYQWAANLLLVLSFLAISRPEGSIMTLIVIAVLIWRTPPKRIYWLFPLAAVGLQPLVNWLMTGSPSSTGGQAKSIFGTIPFYWDDVIQRIFDNYVRMWREFVTNSDYLPILLAPLAVAGLWHLLSRRETRSIGVIIILWLVTISAAISTLDTAFWHFKRYQMPLLVLCFPLAAWGLNWLINRLSPTTRSVLSLRLIVGILLLFLTIPSWFEFHRLYQVNVNNMMAQTVPMARWLEANTSEDALIAVHDVGMMRYLGNRSTLDMVGLTTPGAADAWRNGPGAVAEFLMHHDPPPDYVASYTTARGLNYLADTGIYGSLLAGFEAEYDPADNVALAAEYQGIYRYETSETAQDNPFVSAITAHLPNIVLHWLNVGDIANEAQFHYQWHNDSPLSGFASDVYEQVVFNCTNQPCRVRDGGRHINGEESFTMTVDPSQDAILITRVHPIEATHIKVYINDNLTDTQWIPHLPGQWIDLTTLIPADQISSEKVDIRVVPEGIYMPYSHWLVQDDFSRPLAPLIEPSAQFQDDRFALATALDHDHEQNHIQVEMTVSQNGQAEGDYRAFVHVYDAIDQPPIAQTDGYLLAPPGNWLPGTITETFVVDLTDIPAGNYTVAVGFYDPYTGERLIPTEVEADAAGRRVFIGNVEILDDE